MSSESREVAPPANWRRTTEPGVFLVDGHDGPEIGRWTEAKAFFVDNPAAALAAVQELATQARKPGLVLSFPRIQWQYPTPESLAAAADRAAHDAASPATSKED